MHTHSHNVSIRHWISSPVVVYANSAWTRTAHDLAVALLSGTSCGVSGIEHLFKELHSSTTWRRIATCTLHEEEVHVHAKRRGNDIGSRHVFTASDVGQTPPPSQTFFRTHLLEALSGIEEYGLLWREQNIRASQLALDYSRKGAKGVHVMKVRFCNSTLCVMTETGHIILSVQSSTESLKEGAGRHALDTLAAHLKQCGCEIKVCSSDKPSSDQILRVIFDVPMKGVYQFRGKVDVVHGWNIDDVDRCVLELRENIKRTSQHNGSKPMISVDTEFPDEGDRSTALIQVGNENYAVLIRVRVGERRCDKLPQSIVELLNDSVIEKVGSCITQVGSYITHLLLTHSHLSSTYPTSLQDVTRINNVYGQDLIDHGSNYVELKPIVKKLYPGFESYGLKEMSKIVLGVGKDETVRRSNWSTNSDLSKEQIKYAASDVGLPCEIYRQLHKVTTASISDTPSTSTISDTPSTTTISDTPSTTTISDDPSVVPLPPTTTVISTEDDTTDPLNLDQWSSGSSEFLRTCVVETTKTLMDCFKDTRYSRRRLQVTTHSR